VSIPFAWHWYERYRKADPAVEDADEAALGAEDEDTDLDHLSEDDKDDAP
jgi:CDP-diacylglycerol--serine O-phosphatidyltransferase